MKNPYETLNVGKNATEKEIKASFHKLALEFHPDRNKDPQAEEKFKEISAAYEILSDPEKRSRYDQFGDTSNINSTYGFNGFGNININDIFSNFDFGDFFNPGFKKSKRSVFKGEDLYDNLTIDFMESINGCKKTIKISHNENCSGCKGNGSENGVSLNDCPTCKGHGKIGQQQGFMRVLRTCYDCNGLGKKIIKKCKLCKGSGIVHKEETLTVSIPEGVDNKTVIRLASKGASGLNGGPSGDLYITILVRPHEKFKRRGNLIQTTENISYLDAILGTEIEIETIRGLRKMVVPPLTQNNSTITLNGLGVKGDHLVLLNIKMPEKISEKEKELLEKIKQGD